MHTSLAGHRQKRFLHHLTAATVTVLYLLMLFGPLAMHSKVFAHAVSGECSGDCNICGCSPESRANHTCCCSKKKQQQAHSHEGDADGTPDCCKKKPVKQKVIIACGCPCGKGKPIALSASGTSEVLPFHFTERFSIPHSDTTFSNITQRLTSRHAEPPDPPPQINRIS